MSFHDSPKPHDNVQTYTENSTEVRAVHCLNRFTCKPDRFWKDIYVLLWTQMKGFSI